MTRKMPGKKPAVFVDRDNTLIRDTGYLSDAAEVSLLPGAADSIRRLRAAGFPVVVVTNQSGVARGLISEKDVDAIHRRLEALLAEQDAAVEDIYYCPYLDGPEAVRAEYRVDSDLRKPKPGMLRLAAREHDIDLARSWMIGDSARDIEAGRAAGCRTVLLSPNGQNVPDAADMVAPDLPSAVDRILNSDHITLSAPCSSEQPPAGPIADATLQRIVDELRSMQRERQFTQFSLAHLAGALAQAFALCAIGWGIYAAINGADGAAIIRLLAGIAFQLMALTCFVSAGKK